MPHPTEQAAIRISAPARLHLGFLDLNGELGRRYGSIGLAIDQPETRVLVRRAPANGASGPEAARAVRVLERLASRLDLDARYDVTVETAIPPHAGLGSGTQLALAVAIAVLKLERIARPLDLIGTLTDRGQRSSIGIAAFDDGGFIVDGGRGTAHHPPPVLIRARMPESWRILLVLDRSAKGVHGDRETAAFAALPPMPRATAARLCHLLLMQAAPALAEADIATFGRAVTEIQAVVGAHFAAAQGGSPWSSPKVGELVAALAASGAVGIGQSSWGPTGFAFVPSEKDAQALYQSHHAAAKARGLDLQIVRARNTGALIDTVTTADIGQ